MDHLNALAAAEVPARQPRCARYFRPSWMISSAGSSAATHTIALLRRGGCGRIVPLGCRRLAKRVAEIQAQQVDSENSSGDSEAAKRSLSELLSSDSNGIASAPTVSLFDQDEPKEARKGIGRRWGWLSPQRLQPEPSCLARRSC